MRLLLFTIYLLFTGTVIAQLSAGTTWKYQRLSVVYQSDTLNYFNVDSTKNMFGLERLRITFKANNIYEGLYFNGTKTTGYWQVIGSDLVINSDTNQIINQTDSTLTARATIQYQDSSDSFSGYLITYLRRIPQCSSVESIASGDWNDPAIWSCDRVPDIEDDVFINQGHEVTLLKSMGAHNCRGITIRTGGKFIMAGKVYLKYP